MLSVSSQRQSPAPTTPLPVRSPPHIHSPPRPTSGRQQALPQPRSSSVAISTRSLLPQHQSSTTPPPLNSPLARTSSPTSLPVSPFPPRASSRSTTSPPSCSQAAISATSPVAASPALSMRTPSGLRNSLMRTGETSPQAAASSQSTPTSSKSPTSQMATGATSPSRPTSLLSTLIPSLTPSSTTRTSPSPTSPTTRASRPLRTHFPVTPPRPSFHSRAVFSRPRARPSATARRQPASPFQEERRPRGTQSSRARSPSRATRHLRTQRQLASPSPASPPHSSRPTPRATSLLPSQELTTRTSPSPGPKRRSAGRMPTPPQH